MGLLGGGKSSIRAGRKRAIQELDAGALETEQAFGLALPELLKALQQLGQGYDLGLGEVANVGSAARQRTLDREQGLVGRSRQNLQSRGLSSTTVGTNLERGIAYDTNLALGQIDDQLAQLRSGLRVGKGHAMSQGLGDLAELYMGRGQQQLGQREQRANVWLGSASNLAAADQFQFGAMAGLAGDVAGAVGTAIASDIRLKRNITPAGTRGRHNWYTWDWVWGGSSEGVLAQEVETYQPEAVGTGPGGFKVVYYGVL